MTSAKSTRSKRSATAEELAELRESVEELVELRDSIDELIDLRDSMEELAQRVACLTQAVDELADQVQGQSKVIRDGGYPPTPRLTSMPLDPTADDWKLNRYSADDLPEFTQPPTPTVLSQQQLFDATEADSSLH